MDLRLPYPTRRLTLLILGLASIAGAGAWPTTPGSGKAAVGLSRVEAATVVDARGGTHAYGFVETGLSTYGEVGLIRRLSLGWAWGLIKQVESDSVDASGTTDPELSLTWHLGRRGALTFALQGTGALPLGPENPSSAPDFAPPFFSPGAYALELRPLAGWSGGPWWAQAGAGLRARSHDRSWQFRYAAAAGRSWGRYFAGLLSFDGVQPLDREGSGVPGDQETYYGYHIGVDVRPTPATRLGFQFDSMFTYGQELPLGARLNLVAGLAWR